MLPDRLPAANACSTGLGLYDPLSEIGDFCGREGIWFHVDGAHGAAALFSAKHRGRLRGVEKADSLVWDAHKLMRTPTLCAAVLVKDSRDLDAAFREEASYLFHEKAQPGFDFIHRTVECTKAGLGLKFYAVLAALGEKGIEAYVDGRYELAVRSWEYLSALPDFECAAMPESNILCFRLRGGDGLQLAARERLLAEGNFYVSSVEAIGKRWLRLALMNPATDLGVVKDLAETLRRLAEQILHNL